MSEPDVKMRLRRDVLKFMGNAVRSLADEAKFVFTPQGLHVRAVDAAHVTMMDLDVSAETMNALFTDHYVCEKPTTVGIDMDYFFPPEFKHCEGNEFCVEIFPETYTYLITGRMSKITLDDYTELCDVARRTRLVSVEGMYELKKPNLNLPGKIVTTGAHFSKACTVFQEISDHAAIDIDWEEAVLEVENSDGMQQTVVLSKRPTLANQEIKFRSLFPMDYIHGMSSALKDCPRIELNIGNDQPIRAMGEYKGVKVEFLMAPRIEDS